MVTVPPTAKPTENGQTVLHTTDYLHLQLVSVRQRVVRLIGDAVVGLLQTTPLLSTTRSKP